MNESFIATEPRVNRVLRRDLYLALTVAAATGLLSGYSPAIALNLVAAFALVIRRTHPVLFAGIAMALAGASFAMLRSIEPLSDLIVLTGMYSIAAFAPKRWRHLGFGILGICAVVIVVYSTLGDLLFDGERTEFAGDRTHSLWNGAALLAMTTVSFVAAWALGMMRRQQFAARVRARERTELLLHDAEQRAELAVIEERTRISREMHDIIAHSLASIVTVAEGGRMHVAGEHERALFAAISESGRAALADVRRLLRTVDNEQDDAPAHGVDDLADLVERTRLGGVDVAFEEEGAAQPLPAAMGLAIYRVAQESLTNMLKHAPGAPARIRLRWGEERVELRCENALTAGPTPMASADGRGLTGMRDRVMLFDGDFVAERRPEAFTVVTSWPYPNQETAA